MKESYYILDGNLYQIKNEDNVLKCLLHIKSKGFVIKCNPYDIMFNGTEIPKNEIFKYIKNI